MQSATGSRSRGRRQRAGHRGAAPGVQPGSVFLVDGTDEDNATALTNGAPRVVEVRRIESEQRSPLAVVAAGGPDAEPPPS